jgi:hypothetical protein
MALILTAGSLLIILLAVLLPRQEASPTALISTNAAGRSLATHGPGLEHAHSSRGLSAVSLTPEEIIAGKVTQFAQDRLKITHAMAKQFKVERGPGRGAVLPGSSGGALGGTERSV